MSMNDTVFTNSNNVDYLSVTHDNNSHIGYFDDDMDSLMMTPSLMTPTPSLGIFSHNTVNTPYLQSTEQFLPF